jgi:hypothetical protein
MVISFLDSLVIRKEMTLVTKVYREPNPCLLISQLSSYLPQQVRRGLIQSLCNRASTVCQKRQDLCNEVSNLRHDLQLNDHSQSFLDSVINSEGNRRLNREEKPLGCLSHMWRVFQRSSDMWGLERTLRSSLMKTRQDRDPKQTAHRMYSVLCESCRCYIGKTARPLAIQLCEHRQYKISPPSPRRRS